MYSLHILEALTWMTIECRIFNCYFLILTFQNIDLTGPSIEIGEGEERRMGGKSIRKMAAADFESWPITPITQSAHT